ncbi:hypothetical protein BDC45DRAFT_575428 [Circinella umbellata]|nr:hypothetical protein BDC45DRAFT_575428 [Circinella umbellata]
MIKAFVSSSSNHHHQQHQQHYTTIKSIKQEQQLATRIVLRLTSYGMTDHVYCQCEECPFLKWNGYPIMRFVHPDHVHRLCAGLCEASKTGMAISISDILCTLDSSCTSSSSYDTTIHLTVHESHSLYLCVLYYYPNDILKYNSNNKVITTTIHDRDSNSNNNNNTNRQLPIVLNLAREIMDIIGKR